MNLLTVGDSFTYGEELVDKKNAWPHVLGKMINYNVNNLGAPGTGNTSMVRNVLNNYQSADLIIIAWSHFARQEFADDRGVFDLWPGYRYKWHKDLVFRNTLVDYFSRYHNDVYMYNQYLNNILLMQHFLKSNNKKYIMLDTFLNIDKRQYGKKEIHDQIDSSTYVGWPNETMMEWVYPTPLGPSGHFLEDGHNKVANKIYEYLRN